MTKVNQTIDTYNQYAQVYAQETIEFWEKFPKSVIQKFSQNLPGKKILDIGSGPGKDALLLKEMGLEITCLDASEKMIELTQALGFESHLSDMRDINFPQNSFDGVWAYTSLIHIPSSDVVKVLQKIHQLLIPNGILMIGAIEGNFEGQVKRLSMPEASRYFKHYLKPELIKLVEDAEFKLIYQENYQPHNSVYLNLIFKKI